MSEVSLGDKAGSLAPLLSWVDARFGPFTRLHSVRPARPEPQWWTYLCDVARPIGRHFSPMHNNAQGTSFDENEALRRALAEAIERYIGINSTISASSKVISAAENPLLESFVRCLPEENCSASFKTLPADLTLTHCEMTRLSDGKKVHVPAGFVHMRFQPSEDEPQVNIPNSSGMAFHTHLPRAILSALCEVAERDALMLCWWNRLSAPRICFEQAELPLPLRERLKAIDASGLKMDLFDISSEFPMPVVLCILASDRYPYFAVGSACDADLVRACTRSMDEAVAIRYKQLNTARKTEVPTRETFDWVRTFDDHAELYADWSQCPAFDFLYQAESINFQELLHRPLWRTNIQSFDDLQELARSLDALNFTVLYSDITTEDACRFGHGVRVVVPEMVPISIDHNARWLGSPRILKDGAKDISRFNPYPQPLA